MSDSRRPKVAFVATGGAAKGLAHLGVLLAAEELGVTFDVYVGSSAGAILCAFAGQGVALDRMVDWFRPPWRRRYGEPALSPFRALGVPRGWPSLGYLASGVLSVDPLERYLRRQLPCNSFAEVARDLHVVATDLDSGERTVFGRGFVEAVPLSRAVAASCCVPLLFRPFRIGERFYIDGETKKTFSADVAISRGADVVVISNVYNPRAPNRQGVSLAYRGARAVLGQALNLALHEKTTRGLDLHRHTHPQTELVVIEPDVGHLSFLNHLNARAFIQRGYREALARIRAAQRRGVFGASRRAVAAG